ncbi:MAG: hypothetical protein HZA84_03650 [Thaumarchaeota archaeon]|nr:hypothetical protein [Nitrososphaerota archaeon]
MKERQIWSTDILNLWEWLIITTTPLPLSFAMIIYEKIPVYWFFLVYFGTFLTWVLIGIWNRRNLTGRIRRDYDSWIKAFSASFLFFGMGIFYIIQAVDIAELHVGCYFLETAKNWMMNMPHCP